MGIRYETKNITVEIERYFDGSNTKKELIRELFAKLIKQEQIQFERKDACQFEKSE